MTGAIPESSRASMTATPLPRSTQAQLSTAFRTKTPGAASKTRFSTNSIRVLPLGHLSRRRRQIAATPYGWGASPIFPPPLKNQPHRTSSNLIEDGVQGEEDVCCSTCFGSGADPALLEG